MAIIDQQFGLVSMQYEERYCAFVDILGFGSLIDALQNGLITHIRELLDLVHASPKGFQPDEKSDVRIQSISDAIAMSAACNHLGFQDLIYRIYSLTFRLLWEGRFLHGAICKGRVYHDEKMVFGEGLVRAYKLERDVARFPRTILTMDVVRDIENAGIIGGVAGGTMGSQGAFITQAEDGPHYINIFRQIGVAAEGNARAEILNYTKIAKHIRSRLQEAADNPDHFDKVRWFAREWNRSLTKADSRVKRVLGIYGAGLAVP